MKHLLTLCRVIGLEPVEFLQLALKPRPDQRGPLLRRFEALLPDARADAVAPAPRAAEEEQRFSIEAPGGTADQAHRAAVKLAQEAGKAIAHCCLAFMEMGATGWHQPAAATLHACWNSSRLAIASRPTSATGAERRLTAARISNQIAVRDS